ncbi:cytochrome P450 [Amycolatopsis magusensis]|uniref:Cytochrome P450 n=1 Tax=Amycolatopsis magusensis TaxID=882444 RepID=A0ABS4Q0M4_9PSEU|nr:cytochrome P450 [Amycolatopsis magusensis]MBP2185226.1 cytochrome P450 [Amycolatopsis magusensis]
MSSCNVVGGHPSTPAHDKTQATCPKDLSVYNLMLRPGEARELLTALAARGPVHWDPYVSAWLVCGVDEVPLVLADERFSSKRLNTNHELGPGRTSGSTMDAVVARMMLLKDGHEHLRLKRVARAVLAPQRIRTLEPWMRELAAELLPLDQPRDLDFMRVAKAFPLRVLGRLLGIAESDLDMVLAGSDAITAIVSGLDHTVDPDVHRRARTLHEYALRLVRERREVPGDDGTSALVRAADEEGLGDEETAANLVMLIASGHQTMPGFLSISLHDALRADGFAAFEMNAALAKVTPSRFVGRVATEDAEVGGCRIRASDKVLVLLAAANWQLPPSGKGTRHLAFGHGRHRCAGAAMAELEGEVMFERMAEAMRAGIHLTGEDPEWNGDANLPSLTKLPLRLDAPAKANSSPSGR